MALRCLPLGLAAWLVAGAVEAAPCSDLPAPLYVSSGAVSETVLRRLGPLLAAAPEGERMTVVYVFSQTCDTLLRYSTDAPLTGNGRVFQADGTAVQCEIPEGTRADLGIGNLFAPSCRALNPAVDPARVRDLPYVVSPTVLIVPAASDQFAISAEEAYFVYGFGMAGMVAPWLDDNLIFRRTVTAGTQTVVAQSIGVPAARFRGTDGMTVQNLLMRVAAAPTPRAAIGFVSAAEADANRATVRVLAFRATGQRSFYWPDSRRAAFDRRNVRDGHYPMWNYEHVYLPVTAPVGGRAERFAAMLTGTRPLPGGDLDDVSIGLGFVPLCAMDVARTADDDGTSLAVYEPPAPCTCYFERNVPMGATTCRACTAPADCNGAGTCRRGYCEAR